MRRTIQLAAGELVFYVPTRVFDISRKMASNRLEGTVYLAIRNSLAERGIHLDAYPVFLPFRDTDEQSLHGRRDFFEAIYMSDQVQLNRLFGMLGYLDDPSKDDGVCMEFGYAYAKHVPAAAVVTDSQSYSISSGEGIEFLLDPILERMLGRISHLPELPDPSPQGPTSKSVYGIEQRQAYLFEERLKAAEQTVLETAYRIVQTMLESNFPVRTIPGRVKQEAYDIFFDFIGNKEEWARNLSGKLSRILAKKHITHTFGRRFDIGFIASEGIGDAQLLGEIDIASCVSSRIIVVCCDGPEVDAGAAALIGMARAQKKYIVLYYSGSIRVVTGPASCSRNLMIEFSADYIARSFKDLVAHLLGACK